MEAPYRAAPPDARPLRDVVLDLLRVAPSYGLALMDAVFHGTKGRLRPGANDLYRLLHDLERDGVVESWEGGPLPERGFRPRRYYRIAGTAMPTAGCP